MIPDFWLPVALPGRTEAVLCRDVPAAVFFHGYPLTGGAHAGYLEARDRWARGLMARAIVRPVITAETLERLAPPALADLERRYMAAIGAGPGESGAWLAALAAPPTGSIRGAVLTLARMFHVAPMAIWLAPISEYLGTQAMVLAETPTTGSYGLSPLEGEVGMEDA